MNSRYIGSSDSYQMINDAADKVRKVSLEAAADISKGVQQQLDVTIDANNKILALQNQKKVAEMQADAQPSGLAGAAQAGVSYLLKNKELDLKNNALIDEQAQKLADAQQKKLDAETKEKLKKFYESQATEAESEINDLTRTYLGGQFEGQSIEEYKNEAVKRLSKFDLAPEDMRKIMSSVNSVALERDQKVNTRLRDALDKQKANTVAVAKESLRLDFMSDFANIKKLGATDQATPFLSNIENKLQAFLTANNGIAQEDKLAIAAEMMRMAADNYQVKMEDYVGQNVNLRNFQEYVKGYNQALFEFQNPASKYYNNYGALQSAVGLLSLKWGDFSKYTPEYGEAEKKRLEFSRTVQDLEQIQRQSAEYVGSTIDLGADFSKVVAINAILNPTFAAQANSTELKDNPSVRAGLQLAERYQKYLSDQAQYGVTNTQLDESIARLDLNNANNYVRVLDKLAESKKAGQLSPTEAFLEQKITELAASNPDPLFQAFVAERLQGKKDTQVDVNLLQTQLAQQYEANKRIAQSLRAQSEANRAKLTADYADLAQLGLLVPREQLVGKSKEATAIFDAKLESVRQQIRERASQSIAPTPFGIQPSFNGSSSFAPDVDESGRVRLAPRASLQKLSVNGQQIVTPVIAGARAPITSGYLSPRATHKHAGVDFGMEGNEKAAAIVSGIAHIGTMDGYGGYVDIIGDNGYVYRYAHQQPLVKSGQRVKAGQPVSYSNGTGTNIGGNHLHFEVHKKANFNDKGEYIPQTGVGATIDPIEHLSRLTMGDSNVLQPRQGMMNVARAYPQMRAPANALVTGNGGAIQANTYQQVGSGKTAPANEVFTYQKPLRLGALPWKLGSVAGIRYDPNDDFGYAELRKNNRKRVAIVEGARKLGVPPVWLADIIAQESVFNENLNHGNGYWGLIGFSPEEGARGKSFEQQINMAVDYFKRNGWDSIREKKGGNVTIADLWIITRAGTVPLKSLGGKNMRQFIHDGGDPNRLILDDFNHSFGYELGLLGKNTGRRYSFPGSNNNRKLRNKAVSTSFVNGCTVCASLVQSGSWVPHQHDIGVA